MSVFIKFYNIPDSPNSITLGPFVSIVCDGVEVTAVFEDETEKAIASIDEVADAWHVFECRSCPLWYPYFEVSNEF